MKGKKNMKMVMAPVKDSLMNLRNIATASRGVSGIRNNTFIYRTY